MSGIVEHDVDVAIKGTCDVLDVTDGAEHGSVRGIGIVAHIFGRHSQRLLAILGEGKTIVQCQWYAGYVGVVLVGDDHGKGLVVGCRILWNVLIHIRCSQLHVLLLYGLLIGIAGIGCQHSCIDRVEVYFYVGGCVVERSCIVVVVFLARRGDDGELGECQMILVDEVLRILKLHSVPVGSEDACLVVASWHRNHHFTNVW